MDICLQGNRTISSSNSQTQFSQGGFGLSTPVISLATPSNPAAPPSFSSMHSGFPSEIHPDSADVLKQLGQFPQLLNQQQAFLQQQINLQNLQALSLLQG